MPAGFGMRPWLHAILVKKQVLWCQAFLPSFCQPNGSRHPGVHNSVGYNI